MRRVAIALVHYPVLDGQGAVVTTAVTNLDVHDLARSARTYGCTDYFVVHPIAAQRELVERIRSHWTDGSSGKRIPDRKEALTVLRIVDSLESAVAELSGGAGRTGVEVWVGGTQTGQIRRVENVQLNPMLGDFLEWMPDQQTLLVKLVPPHQGPPPPAPKVPSRPNIQETGGTEGKSSTYEARDTLKSAHDEALFDYYASARLPTATCCSSTPSTARTPTSSPPIASRGRWRSGTPPARSSPRSQIAVSVYIFPIGAVHSACQSAKIHKCLKIPLETWEGPPVNVRLNV